MTADGQMVTASEEENSDLFWGIRGGGGNFGIVTSFEYRLHPVGPTVLAGLVVYPMAKAPELLRLYRDFAAAAPEELGTVFALRMAPPAPFLPQDIHGKPIAAVFVCYGRPGRRGRARPEAPPGFRPPCSLCRRAQALHRAPGHAGPRCSPLGAITTGNPTICPA